VSVAGRCIEILVYAFGVAQFSREAAADYNCGRQPAEKNGKEPQPRSGDSNQLCCRRFAALMFDLIPIRGLTPTAMCDRRFAAKTQ
jgi:hypothetical protein